jgi:hypothetical protein
VKSNAYRSPGWLLALAGLALVAGALLFIAIGQPVPAYPAWTPITAYAIPLLLIGGLVCSKRPGERMGRLVLAQGIGASLMLATGEYATYSVLGRSGALPLTSAAAWVSSVVQSALVVSLILLVLLFPTGRLASRRWRPVAWAVGVGFAQGIGTAAFGGPNFNSNIDFIRNPVAIHPPEILLALVGASGVVIAFGIVGVIAHLIVRFRNSQGEEREQLKWFLSASVFAPLAIFVPTVFFPGAMNGVVGNVAWTIGPLTVIVAMGVAILRYRLYDIDRIINRTAVYALVTALLAACYSGLVLLLPLVLPLQTRSPVVVALSTLLVAAAFRPIRVRVQGFIDRRFNRARYDAGRTLERFSFSLRDQLDIDSLSGNLVEAVRDTMQPERVSLWLRTPSG